MGTKMKGLTINLHVTKAQLRDTNVDSLDNDSNSNRVINDDVTDAYNEPKLTDAVVATEETADNPAINNKTGKDDETYKRNSSEENKVEPTPEVAKNEEDDKTNGMTDNPKSKAWKYAKERLQIRNKKKKNKKLYPIPKPRIKTPNKNKKKGDKTK